MINKRCNKKRQGFTLVELSIVIIIIGILAAGSVVGGKVVENAKFSKLISEISEVNTATVIFQTSFDALPGDYNGSLAEGIGCTSTTISSDICPGDDNGRIETSESGSATNLLIAQNLLASAFSRVNDSNNGVSTDWIHTFPNKFPKSYGQKRVAWHFGDFRYVNANATEGGQTPSDHNLIFIRDPARLNANLYPTTTMDALFASKIDSKIDDGNPQTGTIVGIRIDLFSYTDQVDQAANAGCSLSYDTANNYVGCGLGYKLSDL
jgi:prepilin-type N-terminal cleavage/methylation domain-containing protein